ncbi:MAG: hypothetical protein WC326_14715 [Candidatus Delongbacteria bacterium]
MYKLIHTLNVGLLLAGASTGAAAWESVPVGHTPHWLTLGLGPLAGQESGELGVSQSWMSGDLVWRLGLDTSFKVFGHAERSQQWLSLGWGVRARERWALASATLGPSLSRHVHETRNANWSLERSRQLGVGLGANAQVFVKPLWFVLPEVGLGVEAFGDLNSVHPVAGWRVSLVFHNTL